MEMKDMVEIDEKTRLKAQPDNLAVFQEELGALINKHSMENGSDTPDFMLAAYMTVSMVNFNTYVNMRELWTNPQQEQE